MNPAYWAGRRVFLTGHTGFKGAWLAAWLRSLRAEVTGYARNPSSEPNLCEILKLPGELAADHRADLLDAARLEGALRACTPEVVFHLAAQALVHEGYRDPLDTFGSNVMGTLHVLEAARKVPGIRAVVIVTTDKCYESAEPPHPYREGDRLGGADPYSASKACAEIVTAACRASFFGQAGMPAVASARAGNVIGGGDWAKDRLVPDCVRAFGAGKPVVLRQPNAVRPWQHVLEPLAGYLMLAEALAEKGGAGVAGAWNFGPAASGEGTVLQVASLSAKAWGGGAEVHPERAAPAFKETQILRLDSGKARERLGWRPRWDLERAVGETVRWYRAWHDGKDMLQFTHRQIADYAA